MQQVSPSYRVSPRFRDTAILILQFTNVRFAGQARRGRANVNFDQKRADPTKTHVDPIANYAWGHRRPEQAATRYNIINGQTFDVIPPVIDGCARAALRCAIGPEAQRSTRAGRAAQGGTGPARRPGSDRRATHSE